MLILKIGGSVITDKSVGAVNKAKFGEIERIARDIAENLRDKLILVHGVGSFGHPHVVRYGLKDVKDVYGVGVTHLSCVALNFFVCSALQKFGLNPIPIHPLSSFKVVDGRLVFDAEYIGAVMDEGFIPVLHGDMVYNMTERRFEILSGDKIVVELAKVFKADRIGFATDVEGVMVKGAVVDELSSTEFLEDVNSRKSDVTGGMRGKVELILKYGLKAFVFHARDIDRFLKGERVGTLVRG